MPGHDGGAASPVEQLPQDVVHWLTVLLGGRIARRRGRGGLGGGVLGRGDLGRRLGGRGAARDAALAARPAAALALALAGAALIRATQALLQEIAEGLAKLAAERTGRLASGLSTSPALLPAVRPLLSAEQAADRGTKPGAFLAEQALAHILQLGVGGFGIVEDALHLRINPRAPHGPEIITGMPSPT